MLNLSAAANIHQKFVGQNVRQFMLRHGNMGMFICSIAMPLVVLAAVSILCYAIMLPISFFMGWL